MTILQHDAQDDTRLVDAFRAHVRRCVVSVRWRKVSISHRFAPDQFGP